MSWVTLVLAFSNVSTAAANDLLTALETHSATPWLDQVPGMTISALDANGHQWTRLDLDVSPLIGLHLVDAQECSYAFDLGPVIQSIDWLSDVQQRVSQPMSCP